MQMYIDLGLDLAPAENTVEAGITEVWQALVGGRLKVQRHLANFLREFRKYHRDEKGHIVKADDHLMDCLRYLWMSGRERLDIKPQPRQYKSPTPGGGAMDWFR